MYERCNTDSVGRTRDISTIYKYNDISRNISCLVVSKHVGWIFSLWYIAYHDLQIYKSILSLKNRHVGRTNDVLFR